MVGIVDSRKEEIKVWTSRIIDLSKGERTSPSNWENWITLLCWIVSQPVGPTT